MGVRALPLHVLHACAWERLALGVRWPQWSKSLASYRLSLMMTELRTGLSYLS
jgi:hypothetical protein